MLFNIIIVNLFLIILAKKLPNFDYNKAEQDASYWNNYSRQQVLKAYLQRPIVKKAKNVIIFLGDGMGISTITPSRILKGQLQNKSGEGTKLAFEELPYTALIKTYNVDYQVPDSAGTATAFLCGVKTNKGLLGVTARVKLGEPNCDVVKQNSISSILKWALDSGKSAGIVTTNGITDATPAAGYAHIADRYWEGFLPDEVANNKGCKDIARQLVEDEPGSKLNVIMGGGNQFLYPKFFIDPLSGKPGERKDGQNLVKNWLNLKRQKGLSGEQYRFVDTLQKLNDVNYDKIKYLFGIFNHDHMSYDKERNEQEPSLAEMTGAALRVLNQNPNGYALLVEGGKIDLAHHDSWGNLALYETLAFDKAIEQTLLSEPIEETLIVVTADHSHTFTMNGYPLRGNNIMGIADKEDNTNISFTTLLYGNGPGHQTVRTDPANDDTSALRYRNYAAVYLNQSYHGGEDVALYSRGPMAHLFHSTQEQPFIAHAMAFAACIGEYQYFSHCFHNGVYP